MTKSILTIALFLIFASAGAARELGSPAELNPGKMIDSSDRVSVDERNQIRVNKRQPAEKLSPDDRKVLRETMREQWREASPAELR